MAQIINFPSPAQRRLRQAVLKYKKAVCESCKTTKAANLIRGKLCYGVKRFVFFGKTVCAATVAHVHVTCVCGSEWTED